MTLFVCPTGTSIGATPKKAVETAADYAARIDGKIAADRAATAHADPKEARRRFLHRVSAEAHGLCRYGCGPEDRVLLLASDTDDGVQAADRLAGLIRAEFGAETSLTRVPGLRVDAAGTFRQAGIANVIRRARDAHAANDKGVTVFNVSGGFKGVVPYMTLLGMILGVETIYIFEQSTLLIRLPPLPIRFDETELGTLLPAIGLLARERQMEEATFDRLVPGDRRHGDAMLGMLVDREIGQVALTAAGELVADALAEQVGTYEVRLHERARKGDGRDTPQGARILNSMRLPRSFGPASHQTTYPNLRGLRVWKSGDGQVRLVYWIADDTVWVAEIQMHTGDWDVYRTQQHDREDYAVADFISIPAVATSAAAAKGPAALLGAALSDWMTEVDEALATSLAQVAALEAQLDRMRRAARPLQSQGAHAP